MAPGKIHKRADVDHDRTSRQLAAKFVDREPCKLRWFDAKEMRAALIHAPQPEEIGRIGSQVVKERMDECLLGDRRKQRTLLPLSTEGGRPLPAGADRTERARSVGWIDGQVIRKLAESLMS